MSTKKIAIVSMFIGLGASIRVLFATWALGPLHGIFIKIGLAETLAFFQDLARAIHLSPRDEAWFQQELTSLTGDT